MVTLECFACGHENKPGAMSCAVCSTSLNLKLCVACEAVNALGAERCHDCGAPLVEGLQVQEAPVPVQVAERLFKEMPRIRLLPLQQNSNPPVRTGRLTSLWILSVALAAGAGYYFASRAQWSVSAPGPTEIASHPEARAEAPSAAEAGGDAPPLAAKTVSAKPAKPAAAQAAPAPTRAPAVTHTHATSSSIATAGTAAPAALVEEPAAAALKKPTNNQPATCAPAPAALGLCSPN